MTELRKPSRRSFLRQVAGGAVGVGAMAIIGTEAAGAAATNGATVLDPARSDSDPSDPSRSDSDPVGVNVGNPHAVFFVPDVAAIDLPVWGPQLEHHPLFPARANIEIVQVLANGSLRMRVWERGAGITQACGSGACATLVAAARRGLSPRSADVILDGGRLHIDWLATGHVRMTGGWTHSFDGEIDLSAIDRQIAGQAHG